MWFLFQIAKSKVAQNEGRAGRNRTTAERVRPEYEEDTVGYYEEDTVGYIAARDRLLRALDCCVFLAASGIEWRAVWFLFQGLIRARSQTSTQADAQKQTE